MKNGMRDKEGKCNSEGNFFLGEQRWRAALYHPPLKRLKKIAVCLLAALALQFNTAQNVPVTVEDPLCRAFQATGAELDRAFITGKADIEVSPEEAVPVREMISFIAKKLAIDLKNAALVSQDSNYQESLKLSFSGADRQAVISVNRLRGDRRRVSVVIHHIQRNPLYGDIAGMRFRIDEILKKFNHSPQISTCLEGYLDGKLRKGVWEFCLKDSFAAIDADVVSGVRDGVYMSYAGYSALLPEKIAAGGKWVNFNIAMRYHGFDNRTYVTVGSPLITVDY